MSTTRDYGIKSTPDGVTISVHVAPRASTNKVMGVHNGALKVALTAPPVDGAANRALVEFIAKKLDVPRSAVTIVSGLASRNKVIQVAGVSDSHVLGRLSPGD